MKYFLVLLVLVGIVSAALAAESVGFYKDPKHPGKCVIREDFILSEGEAQDDPKSPCSKTSCGKDGQATITTCGVIAPPPGCKLGEPKDAKAKYPGCCDKNIICVK